MKEYIIEYKGDKYDVIDWLTENMSHTRLSPSGMSGLSARGSFIWRVGGGKSRRVIFNQEQDAMWFALRWS